MLFELRAQDRCDRDQDKWFGMLGYGQSRSLARSARN